jgi:hypothetical protein
MEKFAITIGIIEFTLQAMTEAFFFIICLHTLEQNPMSMTTGSIRRELF